MRAHSILFSTLFIIRALFSYFFIWHSPSLSSRLLMDSGWYLGYAVGALRVTFEFRLAGLYGPVPMDGSESRLCDFPGRVSDMERARSMAWIAGRMTGGCAFGSLW
ncbi:hypothetical protein V8F06_005307 [Rhypophila decipiens]